MTLTLTLKLKIAFFTLCCLQGHCISQVHLVSLSNNPVAGNINWIYFITIQMCVSVLWCARLLCCNLVPDPLTDAMAVISKDKTCKSEVCYPGTCNYMSRVTKMTLRVILTKMLVFLFFWIHINLRLICQILRRIIVKISFLWGLEHGIYVAASCAANVIPWYIRNERQNFTAVIIPPRNEVRGGYTGITPSVCLSVCPSVDAWLGKMVTCA